MQKQGFFQSALWFRTFPVISLYSDFTLLYKESFHSMSILHTTCSINFHPVSQVSKWFTPNQYAQWNSPNRNDIVEFCTFYCDPADKSSRNSNSSPAGKLGELIQCIHTSMTMYKYAQNLLVAIKSAQTSIPFSPSDKTGMHSYY